MNTRVLDTMRLDPGTRNAFQRELITSCVFHCCLNCDMFKQNQCTQFGEPQTPPPEVIVMGCDHWQIYIPF